MRLIDADALIADTLKDPVGKVIAERYNLIGVFEGRPTVDERKTGKWIYVRTEPDGNAFYYCSECGKGEVHVPIVEVKYCWNCGARMEGGKDE